MSCVLKLLLSPGLGSWQLEFKLPKPEDRSNFNPHKTRWKCCINNERPTWQKQQLLDGRTVENKGKLILTAIYLSEEDLQDAQKEDGAT